MARGRRLAFVRRWYERARQADEPYDRFFFAWIAMVAAAQRRRTESGIPFREIYADREKVIEYFEINRSTVAGVLSQHKESLKRLASRKGHRYGQPVMDTRSGSLHAHCLAYTARHRLSRCGLGRNTPVERRTCPADTRE